MKTIQKRADELRKGDVITNFLGAADCSAPAVVLFDYSAGRATIMDAEGTFRNPMIGYDSTVIVEAPALTPAQEHAEELLHWMRLMFDFIESPATAFYNEYRDGVRDLLAKIDPPKAPTLEEALEALRLMCEAKDDQHDYENLKNAQKILDRARRAQVISS